ncbi:MAG: hypothetical protein H6884_05425 [Rhodobiaceae bacterium]|nr:hypothetical protein [Rhodobiaceae bacterium]MCC0053480.1 hypothetical protein [Rhodobiaceae bacterium]
MSMNHARSAACAFLLTVLGAMPVQPAGAASATNSSAAGSPSPQVAQPGPAGKDIPCTCIFNGRDYEQGEQACIRGMMAVCGMYLNNTSWKFSRTPCPLAAIPGQNALR